MHFEIVNYFMICDQDVNKRSYDKDRLQAIDLKSMEIIKIKNNDRKIIMQCKQTKWYYEEIFLT